MKKLLILTLAFIFSLSVYAQSQQLKAWDVSAQTKTIKNPIANTVESQKAGMALYLKNCASCHGKLGLGDGPKGKMLKTFSGDFSKDTYQKQTDGEHFYKTKAGRGEMPKYEGKLSDNDIWNMVNYMRTFKK